ncbi:hypothetical protein IJ182_08120 [bacterium]|nr:hypothetical protein [bacterium]
MNEVLNNKYPYLSKFFETAITQNRLFHSIILYGSNNYIQYAMALELARQLNCLEDKKTDCNCQNCRWIRANQHPAIMTISKIDNKTDSSKTVISEEQINMVLDTLINSSDYHRVFIFCDAEIKKLSSAEITEYTEFKNTGFTLPQPEQEEKIWYPSGINTNCFSTVAANSMLKSIEEPASKITFIFLTNNKDDLLQTIVSRSQSFYVADSKHINYFVDFFKKYFDNYPAFNRANALDFVKTLLAYQTENNCEPIYIMDCIQYYLTEILKANNNNKYIANKIFKDIEKIENSKKMLRSYIKEQTVYEDLAFYLAE